MINFDDVTGENISQVVLPFLITNVDINNWQLSIRKNKNIIKSKKSSTSF